MTKLTFIENYINNKINTEYLHSCIRNNTFLGVDAKEIEKSLNVIRNNASYFLNQLFKDDKLVKINTRPVYFFPKKVLIETELITGKESNLIYTLDEFKALLGKLEKHDSKEYTDPFKDLIGFESSLSGQIDQVKAALMYPPNGLHTLILGESGVGKTTFALKMYEYAKSKKSLSQEMFPFISFNCSDYYSNPQLLVSQLFGHVKGAFTGADSDKAGIIEKANGGIIFLDEIHRLPADGQEMLFYLMDKGEYHRLGESGKPRKCKILIIAATTENPKESLLTAFLRRIPVIITLPPYREKPIQERIDIIESIFYTECINLNSEIHIAPESLKALCLFPFKHGNIGQLKSEIKLLCAKSYLNHLKNSIGINIEFEMLSRDVADYIFNTANILKKEDKFYLDIFNDYLTLSSKGQPCFSNDDVSDDIYKKINELSKLLGKKNLTKDEIDDKIRGLVDGHFKNVINNIHVNKATRSALYKLVSKEVVELCIELISIAEKELNTIFNGKFIFALSLHVNSLLKRVSKNSTIVNSNILRVRSVYPAEFGVAKVLVKKISDKFGIIVPEDEKGFLALLLVNNKINASSQTKIGLIVICHGENTASSMADFCNKLLNTSAVKAIDMPLESDIETTYKKFKSTAIKLNKGHGILLAIDMGSLSNFGIMLEKETGIKVKTLDNVSTLTLLEALRKTLYTNEDVEDIFISLSNPSSSHTFSQIPAKKKIILTFCATGQGSSIMAKKIICDSINPDFIENIDVIATDYFELENNFASFTEQYEVVACVGSVNPKVNIPFFSINRILNKNFHKDLNLLLESSFSNKSLYFFDKSDNSELSAQPKSVYETAKEILEQYLKYINPKLAIVNIKKFIDALDISSIYTNKELLLDLIVHMGCMLDRIINGDKIIFDNIDEFKSHEINDFKKVKNACYFLEQEYGLSISDDEICYIIRVIKR